MALVPTTILGVMEALEKRERVNMVASVYVV